MENGAKAHLMLISGLYIVHGLRSPRSNGDVVKAAFSAASRVDTWQGSNNSTLTVLCVAERNVRRILSTAEPAYHEPGCCQINADVVCVRDQLCKRLRDAARDCDAWRMRSLNEASLSQRLCAVGGERVRPLRADRHFPKDWASTLHVRLQYRVYQCSIMQ